MFICNEHCRLLHCVNGPSLNDDKVIKDNKPIMFVHDGNFYAKVWTDFKDANFEKLH